jgi:hypothetical protein
MPAAANPGSNRAVVGIADHAGWAVLVTVVDGTLVDRRRVTLLEDDLPNLPHHHDAQELPIDRGVALVEKVRASVARCATNEFLYEVKLLVEGLNNGTGEVEFTHATVVVE